MTDERDFDRLARAWLELGPDEAPDRVIAAVLQAAQTTPQVRRPLRWPFWRSLNMNRVSLAAGAAAVLVVIIGGWILLSQRNQPAIGGPVTSPTVAPSPSLEAGIVLQRAPTNLGCDAVASTWDSATIHIDPESDVYLEIANPAWDGSTDRVNVDVWAEVATAGGQFPQAVGTRLAVYWTAGFNATDGDPPVIRGPRGEEVARDGTRIDEQFTRLTGYFTCGGPGDLYVLEYAPG